MGAESKSEKKLVPGTQTLSRGLALLELVGEGLSDVRGIAERLDIPRSTAARMLSNLVAEGYLHHIPYRGYTLGPKLILLGQRATEQRPLVSIAHPFLEALAQETRDTVHFGVLDRGEVLYLEKLSGTRGLEMRSRVGSRMPVASTGLGKSMMMARPKREWQAFYQDAWTFAATQPDRPPLCSFDALCADLTEAAARGWTYDLEENEWGIRCIGAPVRDASGQAIAAVSVASAITFMPEDRMERLGPTVARIAREISESLGWRADQ
ncbi:IclR family transcriptional regulator [Frigidibacter sp. MR17.24]|uniref:IclR family transcriptional regulator n=1 Tax=Frigidibacter sp. MR17.24 TaxID=3127345 RepID=UPI0030131595